MLTDTQVFARLVVSLILGGLIGMERQLHRRNAGLRTHILVSIGSSLIMLTSLYVFDIYKNQAAMDPSRIAAGVITGIGFLGAGAIIREPERIRGLTTAASLWVAAGIGLACGCGFYNAAMYTTGLTLAALIFLRKFEEKVLAREEGKGGQKDGIQ
jgi:putative Mg2+ transporter-C (MgtC) family protein